MRKRIKTDGGFKTAENHVEESQHDVRDAAMAVKKATVRFVSSKIKTVLSTRMLPTVF
jgi:hypothetical protein